MYRPNLEDLLDRPGLGRRELRAVIAALARIAGDSKKEFSPDDTLVDLALDADRPPGIRAMALQNASVDHKRLTVDVLKSLARSSDVEIRREAIRSLTLHHDAARASVLAELAADASLRADLRADATAGLSPFAPDHTDLLKALAEDPHESVSGEAFRALVAAGLATRELRDKPPIDDIKAWRQLIDEAEGEEDVSAGRRLFFHSNLAGCYQCHLMNGRGHQVGPDLTTIRNQSNINEDWLLEHIVNPNAEMAPYYRPQQLLTSDGEILTGLVVGKEGQQQAYVATDGKVFYVDKDDIEERRELTTSIMPGGLLDRMSAKEIRDLIAYLLAGGPA